MSVLLLISKSNNFSINSPFSWVGLLLVMSSSLLLYLFYFVHRFISTRLSVAVKLPANKMCFVSSFADLADVLLVFGCFVSVVIIVCSCVLLFGVDRIESLTLQYFTNECVQNKYQNNRNILSSNNIFVRKYMHTNKSND